MSNSKFNEYAEGIFNDVSKKIMLYRFNQLKSGEDISKDSEGKFPRLTGQIVIDILKGYNQLMFVDDHRDLQVLGNSKDSDNNEIHCYMFTRNCSNHYLLSLKEKYNGNVNDLNLCSHYAMLLYFERSLTNQFNIDLEAIIKGKSQLLYDHLIFLLNQINPIGEEHPFGLNECWVKYWEQSIEGMFSARTKKNKQFNYESYITKQPSFVKSHSELLNQEVISNDLIDKINNWSDAYEEAYRDTKIDMSCLPETIIQYDWDTRFLWLSTHLMLFIHWGGMIDKLKTTPLAFVYGQLVSNTLCILDDIGVDQYQAIRIIPNFFIRLYDYLVMHFGARLGYTDDDLDHQAFQAWYAITASDLLETNHL
ncbi:hypothetical protein [Prochlorococcus sp. MIT 1341]|uniref:hypothetical protein n=1 Tax=Prochlorococcus sp. MIT 1341 TaxID=3096221 RepID=UPI002A75B7C8|nr:hypothetical protein [Prochlorococcus sp. MIT 1341]